MFYVWDELNETRGDAKTWTTAGGVQEGADATAVNTPWAREAALWRARLDHCGEAQGEDGFLYVVEDDTGKRWRFMVGVVEYVVVLNAIEVP
jgi:hypothetical protein